jgi:hypothetical protein
MPTMFAAVPDAQVDTQQRDDPSVEIDHYLGSVRISLWQKGTLSFFPPQAAMALRLLSSRNRELAYSNQTVVDTASHYGASGSPSGLAKRVPFL